jgi:glyoxylase-like metal-dependent hydrolase (beta-lactamase superfamily II)
MSLTIRTFSSGPIGTNTYLVDDGNGRAFVVDASHDVTPAILAAAKDAGLTIEAILITHPHWDHIGDAQPLHEATGAPLIAHPGAVAKMENPGTSLNMPIPPIPSSTPDSFLDEGDTFTLGDDAFAVWHLPGHEPSHIVLYHAGDGVVLGGDVLFPNGHGRIDIPGADAGQMRNSLVRLGELPDAVIVYPGHGDSTTIGAERRWLPVR